MMWCNGGLYKYYSKFFAVLFYLFYLPTLDVILQLYDTIYYQKKLNIESEITFSTTILFAYFYFLYNTGSKHNKLI